MNDILFKVEFVLNDDVFFQFVVGFLKLITFNFSIMSKYMNHSYNIHISHSLFQNVKS